MFKKKLSESFVVNKEIVSPIHKEFNSINFFDWLKIIQRLKKIICCFWIIECSLKDETTRVSPFFKCQVQHLTVFKKNFNFYSKSINSISSFFFESFRFINLFTFEFLDFSSFCKLSSVISCPIFSETDFPTDFLLEM
jgi:hypothetical protein